MQAVGEEDMTDVWVEQVSSPDDSSHSGLWWITIDATVSLGNARIPTPLLVATVVVTYAGGHVAALDHHRCTVAVVMHAHALVVVSRWLLLVLQVDMFYRLQRLIAEDKARQHAQPSDMAAVRTSDTYCNAAACSIWLCCRTGSAWPSLLYICAVSRTAACAVRSSTL